MAQGQLWEYSKSAINESHSCEEGEIRGWREGSTDYLVSTVFPHLGCAHKKLPADPSMLEAVQGRFIFLSQYCIRMTLLEVTLDDGEDARMNWGRDHQHTPHPQVGGAWQKSRKREEILANPKCWPRPNKVGCQPGVCSNTESRPPSDLHVNKIPRRACWRQKGLESCSH